MPIVNSTYIPQILEREVKTKRPRKLKYKRKTPQVYLSFEDGTETTIISITTFHSEMKHLIREGRHTKITVNIIYP